MVWHLLENHFQSSRKIEGRVSPQDTEEEMYFLDKLSVCAEVSLTVEGVSCYASWCDSSISGMNLIIK